MNEIASAIASAVEEQGSATQEIARNVQQAALGTGEISSNVAGVQQAAGDTGAAAHQVLEASSELSQAIRDDARVRSKPSSAASRPPDRRPDELSSPRAAGRRLSEAFADDDSRTGAANVGYFLTQITRTTDAFASVDPPAAFTPLALRNSRTVSAGTSTACAAGVAFAGPATTAGFNSARPANLPSASSAAAPEKPSAGAGDSARSPPPPTGATCALTLLAAAPPPWFCGSAMPVSSTADFARHLPSASGFKPRAP